MNEPEQFPPQPEDCEGDNVVPVILMDQVVPGYPPRQLVRGLQTTRGMRRHLRAIRGLLNALLFLALMYTITLAKALLIPLVLAAFLGLALNPLVAAGTRIHLPRWLTASVLMIGLIVGIGSGVSMLAQPAAGWFHGAPQALKSFVPKLKHLTQPLEAANRATQTLVSGTTSTIRTPATPSPPMTISAWDVVSTTPKVLAAILSVVLLVFFFLIYGDTMLRRLVEITPSFGYKRHAVVIVRGIQTEISRYLLTALLINAGLGAITAAMLWLFNVPDPLLWGAVATLANFIPYVGAITTTTVLALVGLMNFNDAGSALLPVLTFAGITALEGNLVTPMIQGRRMRLSPIAILLWLLIWGWLWGIPGALLAVPMLTSTKLVAERIRGWRWFALMVQR